MEEEEEPLATDRSGAHPHHSRARHPQCLRLAQPRPVVCFPCRHQPLSRVAVCRPAEVRHACPRVPVPKSHPRLWGVVVCSRKTVGDTQEMEEFSSLPARSWGLCAATCQSCQCCHESNGPRRLHSRESRVGGSFPSLVPICKVC